MRVILATVALSCLVGAALAVLNGNFLAAVLFSIGVFVTSWWFVAYIGARDKVDGILHREEHERENGEQ